jgi:hypothetical protein
MSISLATKGIICIGGGGAAVVTEFVPDAVVTLLEPEILTSSQKPTDLSLLVVDPEPTADVEGAEIPDFQISPVSSPEPTADTRVDSKTPEVLIRPVVDLKPRIIDGDD